MAKRPPARLRPVQAATARLMDLVAKGVPPHRIAREVDVIVAEWMRAPDADRTEARTWLDEMREQIVAGVADAEEQVSYVDPDDAAAAKQAGMTLAALKASHDAVKQAAAAL